MEDLIKALQILLKYGNPTYPTHCEHDSLYVDISPDLVSEEDQRTLKDLGFVSGKGTSEFEGGFYSYKYGSC